MDAVIAECTSD